MASRGWALLVAAACLFGASQAGAPTLPGYTAVEASGSAYSKFKGCPHNYYHRYRCNRWWGRRRHRSCCRGNENLDDRHNLRVDRGSTSTVRFMVPPGESTRRAIVRFYVRAANVGGTVFEVHVKDGNSVPNTAFLAASRPSARGDLICTARLLVGGSVYECDVTKAVNQRRDKKRERALTFELYGLQGHARLSSSYTADSRERPQLIIEDISGWEIPTQFLAPAYDDGWTQAGGRRGQSMWATHPDLLVTSSSQNAHLRFRIPEWGVASGKARLVLLPASMSSPVQVYGVDASRSGNWGRSSLSWNRSPRGSAAGSKRICTIPVTKGDQPATCDITEYVESMEEGWKFKGGVIEIRLQGGTANFRSSRTMDWRQRPRLELTYKFK